MFEQFYYVFQAITPINSIGKKQVQPYTNQKRDREREGGDRHINTHRKKEREMITITGRERKWQKSHINTHRGRR